MTRSEKVLASKKRNTARRTQWALRKIQKHQPKNLLEASELGLVCVHVGGGSFREAYKIAGTTLLIKFPITERKRAGGVDFGYTDASDGKYHTRAEVRKIKALQKFKCLRKHMPPVYYYNGADGVMVTKFFKKARRDDWESRVAPILSGVIKELTGVTLDDLFGDNIRMDTERDRLVIIDLGY